MPTQESFSANNHEGRGTLPMFSDLVLQQHLMVQMLPEDLRGVSLEGDGEQIGLADKLFEVWAPIFGDGFRQLSEHLQRAESGYEYELYTRMLEDSVTDEDVQWLKNEVFSRSPLAHDWNPQEILH